MELPRKEEELLIAATVVFGGFLAPGLLLWRRSQLPDPKQVQKLTQNTTASLTNLNRFQKTKNDNNYPNLQEQVI